MAFPKEVVAAPESIGTIEIFLVDPASHSDEPQRAFVSVQIVMSDNRIISRNFNLADHVAPQVITQLQALAADLRTKAQAIIP